MFKIIRNNVSSQKIIYALPRKLLSASVETREKLETFRTLENNPLNHSANNIGQFYTMSTDIKKQLFLHGGLPKSFQTQVKTFTETCIMIREPAIDIISCLKSIDFAKPVIRFVLYGKKGSGKSLTLAHILHYCYLNGFLLVHVPWVGSWMRRCKENSNSSTKEGYVDLNLDAAAWLMHFKHQNSNILENPQLVISKDYEWSKREVTSKGSKLLDLVDHGINRVKFASECIVAVANEIKLLSSSNKCKTLVAVDGFNAFFYPNTRVYTEKKEMVHPHRVTVTQAFLTLTEFNWSNAVCVVTVDEIAIAEKDQVSHLPRYLLGKSGFDHLDPFVPVCVSEYTNKEFTSCMDYYRERKWVQNFPGMDDELKFLSGSNPYKLMELSGPL